MPNKALHSDCQKLLRSCPAITSRTGNGFSGPLDLIACIHKLDRKKYTGKQAGEKEQSIKEIKRNRASLEGVDCVPISIIQFCIMKNLVNQLIGRNVKSWWLETSTESPRCEYYFGPFGSESEAVQARSGYVEDLEHEGSELLRVSVVRRQAPAELTVEYPEAA